MQIKKASTADMPEVVELIKIILDEMELPFYLENEPQVVTKLFVETFKSPTYAKLGDVIVAKVDDRVAGVAFGYPGQNEVALNHEFENHFDKIDQPAQAIYVDDEADDDEWYLNSLAVSPHFQNQGIGTKLLNAIPDFARERGLNTIGLLVDDLNPNAERLYRRLGFTTDREQVVAGHQYKHLKMKI
jgi:ribosomal protein S18 acetylase RimI-like enzyme